MNIASDRIRLLMQLRQSGVADARVLSAMEAVPRDGFIEGAFGDQAHEDIALPIACGQTISQPTVVAWMTQALEVDSKMRVLEIGTGSGYQTAILAQLCRRVYTIERHPELMKQAQARFEALGIRNVTAMVGDGSKGWPKLAPFDRIIVTAAAEEVPQALLDQLVVGGIMVIPVGAHHDHQELLKLSKTTKGVTRERLMDVRFVPLVEEADVG